MNMNMNATDMQTVVIVGTGLAGGNAAVTLHQEGWRGRIVLLGSEPTIPFGRPPLSKTYLRGEEDLSDWIVKPADWYEEHDIELRTNATVQLATNRTPGRTVGRTTLWRTRLVSPLRLALPALACRIDPLELSAFFGFCGGTDLAGQSRRRLHLHPPLVAGVLCLVGRHTNA